MTDNSMSRAMVDVIQDAVRAPYEKRVCVYCRQTGIHAGDYPVPIDARGETFAHLGCYWDEMHEIEQDERPYLEATE